MVDQGKSGLGAVAPLTPAPTAASAASMDRSLLDQSPVLTWTADVGGTRDWVSRKWLAFTGRASAEDAAGGWFDDLHPEDRERCLDAIQAASESRQEYRIEYRLRAADDSYRWIADYGGPRYSPDGEFAGWVGSGLDIDDQKMATLAAERFQKTITRAAARARIVADTVPVLISLVDADERYQWVNAAYEKWFGITRDQIEGRTVREILGEPAYAVVAWRVQAALAGEEQHFEEELEYELAGRRTVRVSYVPAQAPDGTFDGYVALVEDVTSARRGERDVQVSEERLRLAQRVSRMGTWEWDVGSNQVTWSEEMKALYGVSQDDSEDASPSPDGTSEATSTGTSTGTPAATFDGTFDGFIAAVHPDDREAMLASIEGLLADGYHEIDHRIVRPDGQVRWIAARGKLFYNDHGGPLRAIGIGLDVTDRHRTEEELREANQAKDELLGLVSHELRTPLTTLRGNAGLLRERADTLKAEERAAALADLERDAQRLQRIIENMLVLAHAESVADFALEPVLLHRVVESEVTQHQRRSPIPPVVVGIEDVLPVIANEGYVRQILANLLSNAVKYGMSGGQIEVDVKRSGHDAVISVSDRGGGLPPESYPQLFEPFYRDGGNAAWITGLGLGLTVCKRLVELQSGRIWAEARDGGGSCFSFTLPIATEDDSVE